MRMLVAVACVGMAGCADPGAGFPLSLYVSEQDGAYYVVAPDYQMTFAVDGVRMPTSLKIAASEEALASDPVCPNPRLIGTSLYPSALAAGDSSGTSTVTVLQSGPAIGQIEVEYHVPFRCASDQDLHGVTRFTYFPSGRIVRHDVVYPVASTLVDPTQCQCGLAFDTAFALSSFWSFAAPRLVGIDASPLGAGPGPSQVCAAGPQHVIALAWSGAASRTVQYQDTAASVFDFAAFATTLPAGTQGEVTSAIQIVYGKGEAFCPEAHQGLIDNAITVDGVEFQSTEDGLYHDPTPHSDMFTIRARDGVVPPFGAVFALGKAEHVRVSQPDGTFVIQPYQGDAGERLFWFERGLLDNESITIEPY